MQPLHNLSSLISLIFSNLLLSMCGLSPPFGLMFFCICCSFLFIPVPDPELPAPIRFPLSTSAFSSLSYHPVTVTEPETVIGKIPSEHKRMTFTHVPRVKFSNNLRFPSPLSCSESISFRLSVYLSSLRFFIVFCLEKVNCCSSKTDFSTVFYIFKHNLLRALSTAVHSFILQSVLKLCNLCQSIFS